jgi:glycerate 2-kinase
MFNNRRQLRENASTEKHRKMRDDALTILEAALNAVDPKNAVMDKLRITEGNIVTDGFTMPLGEVDRILIVGGGKAGGPMAEALEEILGDKIEGGVVNMLRGTETKYRVNHVKLNPSSHPVPDDEGVKGVREMMSLTSNLSPKDLVFAIISGGGSALMPLPADGVSLEDVQDVTRRLLSSGATINELNAVRKHLSAFKGGQLAANCYPATLVSLILSDVVGDPLDIIASGPTAPDPSTYETAHEVLVRYGVWGSVSPAVKKRIKQGLTSKATETPKPGDHVFDNVYNVVVANNLKASQAAAAKAEGLGYNTEVISTFVEGEARHVGTVYAGLARSVAVNDIPVPKPGALLLGGETTVTVTGSGIGGRNQELALSALMRIAGHDCVILALGSDGIDGPTDAAGALVDGASLNSAKSKGLDPEKHLIENDSYSFFKDLGDAVFTGPTGTNVNDLTLILAA